MNLESNKRNYHEMIGTNYIKQEPQQYSAHTGINNSVYHAMEPPGDTKMHLELEELNPLVKVMHNCGHPFMNKNVPSNPLEQANYLNLYYPFTNKFNDYHQQTQMQAFGQTPLNTANDFLPPNLNLSTNNLSSPPIDVTYPAKQDKKTGKNTDEFFFFSFLKTLDGLDFNNPELLNQYVPTNSPNYHYPKHPNEPISDTESIFSINNNIFHKIGPSVKRELAMLKKRVDSEKFSKSERHVELADEIGDTNLLQFYSSFDTEVRELIDDMYARGYGIKKLLLDFMNRITSGIFNYNPLMSHTFLDYDALTMHVIKTLNNIASRRSRIRKKFADRIKENCLKIDLEENKILRRKEDIIQAMIEKVEDKMLSNDIVDHNMIKMLRASCGLK